MDNEKNQIHCVRQAGLQSILSRHRIDALLVSNNKNIRYLTGFTGSNGLLFVNRRKSYLFTDGRYIIQAKEEVSGAEILITHKPIPLLKKIIKAGEIKRLGLEEQSLTLASYRQLEAAFRKEVRFIPIKQGIVEKQRRIKDPSELEKIKQAIEITGKAYSSILAEIKPGVTEVEIALKLEWAMRSLGAEAVSFETIVASGNRSALPHGRATDKPIEDGDFVVIDFGASFNGYCADVTRTLLIGDQPKVQQRKIYNLVFRVQKLGIEIARPGIPVSEIDRAIRGEIEEAGYGQYFVHSSGHGLGLDIHEHPRIYKTDKTILQPGMVFTIEPGVYLPDLGGVRIEDMLVVTENGCEVLTGGIPKCEFI